RAGGARVSPLRRDDLTARTGWGRESFGGSLAPEPAVTGPPDPSKSRALDGVAGRSPTGPIGRTATTLRRPLSQPCNVSSPERPVEDNPRRHGFRAARRRQ